MQSVASRADYALSGSFSRLSQLQQVRFFFENCALLGCYHCWLRNNPEERSSHLLHCGNLKPRRIRFVLSPREVSVSDIIYGVYHLLDDDLKGIESISKGIITNSSQNLERKVFLTI